MNSQESRPMRVAVIGSGISGLSAGWLLSTDPERKFHVTVYESGSYLGGHTNTVDVDPLPAFQDSHPKMGVDTGFIVCNPITYPNFFRFLEEINVPIQQSDMSFSVSRNGGDFEWCGDNLNTVFAQRSNLFPFTSNGYGLYRMIYDIVRFHDQAIEIANEADRLVFDEQGLLKDPGSSDTEARSDFANHPLAKMSLKQFFEKNNYSLFFYDNYILPMTASIWSSPADITFDKFPLLTLVRFMRNHQLLQIGGRPKWQTVRFGSREYVKKVHETIDSYHINTKVVRVCRSNNADASGPVTITTEDGKEETFDHVIFACHSDQALSILGESATKAEREILGAIRFSKNRAVLHRDPKLMPKRRTAWASWNYLTTSAMETKSGTMSLTYWMNRLQTFVDPAIYGEVFVTMNPLYAPDPATVIKEFAYEHPIYSAEAIQAQEKLNQIQNKFGTSYCGAWTNYGFHEDGCTSGLLAAISLGAKSPFPVYLNGGYPTTRLPPLPPASLRQKGVERYVPPPPTRVVHKESKKPGKRPLHSLFNFTLTVALVGILTAAFYYHLVPAHYLTRAS